MTRIAILVAVLGLAPLSAPGQDAPAQADPAPASAPETGTSLLRASLAARNDAGHGTSRRIPVFARAREQQTGSAENGGRPERLHVFANGFASHPDA